MDGILSQLQTDDLDRSNPCSPTYLISDDTKNHSGYVPNDRSGEPHFVMRTSQEIRLCRRAYIFDVGKHPSLHSYLDAGHKDRRDQLRYQEPVSCNALNVEAPTLTQKCRTRWNFDIMSQLEILQKRCCL